MRGIFRKNPTKAAGGILASGTPGTLIPAGQTATHASGFVVVSTTGALLGEDGIAAVAVQAQNAGAMHSYSDEPVVFNSPPSGVNADALLNLRGGTNRETNAELLARLLFRMQHPPGGGNKYDYENWALSVDGVKTAICLPNRRGLGTVDVLVTSGLTIPTAAVLAAVQALLDEQRPVACKDVLALAPVEILVNTSSLVALNYGTLAELYAEALSAQQSLFAALAPGQALIIAGLNAAMMSLARVRDCRVTEPAANVEPGDIGWARLGEVTLLPMPEESNVL